MPQPIDVGSILGGRYKVTGRILASAEDDVILDGLDQVLNRPVSILVSAVDNSQNLTQSAREVATGERVSNVSILDLGTQDDSTYLIAARTTPADLLDLVVPTEDSEEQYDGVYHEPFFTDTLGTEIFGSARDAAPSAGAYVYEDNTPLTPAHPSPVVRRAPTQPPAAAPPAQAPTAAVPAAPVVPAPVPPAATTATPKVTLWGDDDYSYTNDDPDAAAAEEAQPKRGGTFPAAALLASEGYAAADYDSEGDGDEPDDGNSPRSGGRWLTGIIVAVLIAAALVFAISHIGSLFNGGNVAGGDKTTTASQPSTGAQAPSKAPAPVVVPPAIKGITDITAYLPGAERYNDIFLPRLKDATDGNKATYWPTVEFSNDTFAGVADSADLAIELKQESTIGSVTINQIGGSGGQFNILTNSKPSLDGSVKIGSGSFSAPDFTLKAAAGVKAKYVIISFTQLPRLQPFKVYPFGLKIAEISVK
ncbi:ABC transporter substrate-binding protein [Arthrobacter livingstonensis]|uniref:ABC transporter substrate-binding protein n=1 Tax=Arthrobacter livingstonensis TaxID=670078 RepID=A0A2V5LBB4_9MICC|nr:ABC transporter substrate-binding protein [Arthrobacter livingstonensis]PYI68112.1 ABC transporter substrate-binding protein [Arthrobacter livingstonensis]